ncbi:MAG: Stp1/IreP family PP2C-type Ser/Thr phosphatase [Eubacteriales bacterium]|nr:Stp1/IreP family PP2C-type Ser/Thr phosphatase [Eubacteriales bacterium]
MKSFSITDVGRVRRENQDFVFASDGKVGTLPNLFIVADGMGGHNAGDRASSCAVKTFLKSVRRTRETSPVKVMSRAVEKANEKVFEEAHSDRACQGMGTTIVAATIKGGTLYVANVGDSRLYLIRDEITQITRDHSLVEEMIRAGGITKEEGRNHPDKNVITRAVGVDDNVAADIFDIEVTRQDMILMCSDGLSNMLSDQEMYRIVKEEKNIERACRRLVDEANRNGGRDNITVLLVSMRTNEVRKC